MIDHRSAKSEWADIECQLDEILLQMDAGIPEEHIMRAIGIPFDEWTHYKAHNIHPILSLFRSSALIAPLDRKRKPRADTFKTYPGHYRCAP